MSTSPGHRLRSLLPALVAALCTGAGAIEPGLEIVWRDEFGGASINTANWTHEVNAWGGGNNELQYYTARTLNSFVSGGNLTIRARKEPYTEIDPSDGVEKTRQYTSARLNSRFKGDWTYGRMEVRAKLPSGQGLWPAIWMLPSDYEYGGWAASGEIDILELRGETPTEAIFSLHYGAPYPGNVYSSGSISTVDLSQDFHVYAVEWEEGRIRWFLDGELVQTRTSWWSSAGAYPAPFNKRFHLLLNVAVGGNFLMNPPENPDYFPQEMVVDWVRVSQIGQQRPYLGAPVELPGRIEAEHFDLGGQGYAYNDTTGANLGDGERPEESVDLEVTSDPGSSGNLGFVQPGEWVEYSVTVPADGSFTSSFRTASAAGGGTATLRVRSPLSRAEYTTGVTIPSTGGWQTWTTVEGDSPLEIPAGDYIARLEFLTGEFNVNWFELALPAGAVDGWFLY
ncbi:MAG: family 16 glycosylhydrolase [Candidatus Sumerlaeia bacterium]|nr:family 16 glycosylhydrolase [Candidatus Sumerlaeia bacterium]